MFERFTSDARRTVTLAVEAARAEGATETRPEHLFAVLLTEEDSLAVRVLEGLGASAERLRSDLDVRRGRTTSGLGEDDAAALATIGIDLEEVLRHLDGDPVPGRRTPRFGRASKKVLELSLREAIALGHHHIGTEHLLLGMVSSLDPTVLSVLHDAGVSPGALRPAVDDAVRRAG